MRGPNSPHHLRDYGPEERRGGKEEEDGVDLTPAED